MISKLFPLIVLCILSFVSTAQVNFLHNKDWEEAKSLASESGKPILIDFYTTWCGPCKMMDKTTFSDSIVSDILNDHFICLKLDAEKEINKDVVNQFKINSYPTFIFANANGDLISIEKGLKPEKEFAEICTALLHFLSDDLSAKMSNDNIGNLSDDELEKVFSDYSNINFGGKSELKRICYDKIASDEEVSLSAFEFLANNYSLGDRYHLLIDLIPKEMLISDRIKLRMKFTSMFELLFKDASLKNDRVLFNEVSNNYSKAHAKFIDKTFNVGGLKDPSKEIRIQRMSFYLENELYDQYFNLADSMITEFILPISINQVKTQDEFIAKSMRHRPPSEISGLEETKKNREPSLREEMRNNNIEGLKLAHRLTGISENIVQYIDDNIQLEKALEWTDLAILYVDLPEYRILKAAILNKLDKKAEGEIELGLARKSPYFNTFCEKKITKLF